MVPVSIRRWSWCLLCCWPSSLCAEFDRLEYPQQREIDGHLLTIHAPQIRTWPEFATFTAISAIELKPHGESAPRFGTVEFSGSTEVDLASRAVIITAPTISAVQFADLNEPAEHADVVRRAVLRARLEVPVDLFLAYLADDVLSNPPPPGFNTDPPPILVRKAPTLLVFVNGESVSSRIPNTALAVIVNANWPVYRDTREKGAYYLLDQDRWYTSKQLDKGWKVAKSLPDDFTKLADDPEYAAARAAVPIRASTRAVAKIVYADRPTELVVTDGKPVLEEIAVAGGLRWVRNTESPLFVLDAEYYFLAAGRWFKSKNLDKGPWTYVFELPSAFRNIPEDHPRAAVRASVPGTVEAKMAALEASLPTKQTVAVDAAPAVDVSYAGVAKFEPIEGTDVARAVNSGYDVIQYEGIYYLCYGAVWYTATSPVGPWNVARLVPEAIYAIPPSSPSYHVTQVTVVQSTPTTVVYSSTPAYSSSVWVVYGVPYYGTGWYYPPYIWGGYYYPYWGGYGHGSWYNPATGGYGSRSVWYGPYGGYSYTQGYNPRTGRYGYMETAWDGENWASHGQTYNPRTGIGTDTSRIYDGDDRQLSTSRTVARGDDWMATERHTDFDGGVSQVDRVTSGGGSSTMRRTIDDGALSSAGSVTTGDGRSYSITGEQARSGGSSTITGAEGSVDLDTQRQGGRSVTDIDGSGGGQGTSIRTEGGRTTVGQSGSGDLYAGHNGNVYKKSDDGWQKYEDGGWSEVDTPARPEPQAGTTRQRPADYSSQLEAARSQSRDPDRASSARGSFSGRDYSQLQRDYSARQRGSQQYRQRSGGFQQRSGGLQRGGGFQRGRR